MGNAANQNVLLENPFGEFTADKIQSHLISDGQNIVVKYVTESDGEEVAEDIIMPDIEDIFVPENNVGKHPERAKKVVIIKFANGDKQMATCDYQDEFNLETGIEICLMKEMLQNLVDDMVSGSSLYNNIMKHALTKVNYEKKRRETLKSVKRALNAVKQEDRERRQKRERAAREEKIDIIVEALRRTFPSEVKLSDRDAKQFIDGIGEIVF